MPTVPAKYNPKTKKLYIKAQSTDFFPAYFKYVLEYLKIPNNTQLIFIDKSFKNINEFLNTSKGELKQNESTNS